MRARWLRGSLMLVVAGGLLTACSTTSTSSAPATGSQVTGVVWMQGTTAPGTPDQYNKVGVIKVGPATAKNVLILEPGQSAGSAIFVPLARLVVSQVPGWQVWSVERRENLLEDQSQLNLEKTGKATAQQVFNYYLGYLTNPKITNHFKPVPNASVGFAKQWGMNVAVNDLRAVVSSARRLGGKVVLGGHSLGGPITTAYATWDFKGHPGADDLAGLVFIDPLSGYAPVSSAQATQEVQALDVPSASPWLALNGIAAPTSGVYNATASLTALTDPNAPSLSQAAGVISPPFAPPVPATNLGQYAYPFNAGTGPPSYVDAFAHLGTGLSATGNPRGWDGTGALSPVNRYATMFSGIGLTNTDGNEWYFPQRLTDDAYSVDDGNSNPAQAVLGVHATMGSDLPKSLRIYAFAASLYGPNVLTQARQLAAQSGILDSNLLLVDESGSYAHLDPLAAYPHNAFVDHLVPFLKQIAASAH